MLRTMARQAGFVAAISKGGTDETSHLALEFEFRETLYGYARSITVIAVTVGLTEIYLVSIRAHSRLDTAESHMKTRSILSLAVFCLLISNAADCQDFNPWTDSAVYEITYVIDVSQLAQGTHRRLWIPLPRESIQQSVLSAEINVPWAYQRHVDKNGNAMIYIEIDPSVASGTKIVNRFKVRRSPFRGLTVAETIARTTDNPALFLDASEKIPLQGLIREIAETEGKGISSKKQLIRTYYDYVFENMTYSKEGEGWGEGDAIWACTSKYGNCTDFHSLFIGMARSQQIAARFFIGFPLADTTSESRHDGYHCWAEVYEETTGWLPVDISEAKNTDSRNAYFGHLPSNRVDFTMGRDLVLTPSQHGKPLNFFIYPYAEVDDRVIDKLPVELYYKRLSYTRTSIEEATGE